MALAPVAGFSGGESARLALALVVWQQPNLLLLDEPTNHLDLEMREAVALALQEYEGAMVLVSHDRHLLRTATDTLMVVADGGAGAVRRRPRRLSRLARGAARGRPAARARAGRRAASEKRAEAEARQARARTRKPLENRLKKLEVEIGPPGSARSRGSKRSSPPRSSTREGDQDEVAAALRDQARCAEALEQTESEWLRVQAELEAIE